MYDAHMNAYDRVQDERLRRYRAANNAKTNQRNVSDRRLRARYGSDQNAF